MCLELILCFDLWYVNAVNESRNKQRCLPLKTYYRHIFHCHYLNSRYVFKCGVFKYVLKKLYLTNKKIMNCIVLSIILNYLVYIIKHWMVLCMHKNLEKSLKFVPKKLCCTTFYSDSNNHVHSTAYSVHVFV